MTVALTFMKTGFLKSSSCEDMHENVWAVADEILEAGGREGRWANEDFQSVRMVLCLST